MLSKFPVKKVKWYQFIQNQVKFVLEICIELIRVRALIFEAGAEAPNLLLDF